MPPPGKSRQAAEGMHREASVEKDLTNWRMPERHHPRSRSLLGLQRNQAESVVGEMHRDVESDDNATDRTEPGETSRWNQTALNVTAKRTRKTETRNLLILWSGGGLTVVAGTLVRPLQILVHEDSFHQFI